MDSTVSSWKTNLLLSSRTPRHFWVLALLLTLILHFLIIWLLSDWLRQKPKKPQFLRVEWLPPPQKPVMKKTKAQIPIPVPEETEEPDKLNDLIQKEPAEKLSMKMLKTAKKNPDSEKSEISQGLPSEPAGIKKNPENPVKSKEDPSKSSSDSIRSQTKSPKESSEENELEDSKISLNYHETDSFYLISIKEDLAKLTTDCKQLLENVVDNPTDSNFHSEAIDDYVQRVRTYLWFGPPVVVNSELDVIKSQSILPLVGDGEGVARYGASRCEQPGENSAYHRMGGGAPTTRAWRCGAFA